MIGDDAAPSFAVRDFYEALPTYSRRLNGKLIKRRIERSFDSILDNIAHADPTQIRQVPQARWLLDNSHLVRQALQQIDIDLSAHYHHQLTTTSSKQHQAIPRIFSLVEQAIAGTTLPLDCEAMAAYCRDYESSETPTKLTLGELWAVPIALRIVLLLRLCEAAQLTSGETLNTDDSEADDTTVVAGCIISLRTVATFNWPDFVERTSMVEQQLNQDPSGCYSHMDFQTRDHYRRAIEQISKRTRFEQWKVAEAALELANEANDDDAEDVRRHIGYYLIDQGRRQLEAKVGYHCTFATRVKRQLRTHAEVVYLTMILGLAICASIAMAMALMAGGVNISISITAAIVALLPLLSISGGTVNFLVSLLVPPHQIPKLEFSEGLSAGMESIVAVPMLLSTPEDIAENLHTLEMNYLGNSDPRLRYALLSDFTDAPIAETTDDQLLLGLALDGIAQLNRRYERNGVHPFLLFNRQRVWNDNAQLWMGWERKRGKLEEFNDLIRGSAETSYVVQPNNNFDQFGVVRYVITLDADTYMPTGAATRLIGAMAHPLNRAQFDKNDRIVAGYSVMQPRLETNPVTCADTLFARIFAGDTMLDLYTNAASDAYQDLFDDAVFAGKGIYDVDAFRRSVAKQIPSDSVLSHDLLEGLHGRAGLVSDIVLLENYPSNYLVYLRRLHRWIRGDWQLLPWLVPNHPQRSPRFVAGCIGWWKLFDNLRRSLVSPAILGLLIFGWIYIPENIVVWTLLFALLPGLPILLRVTLALRTSSWRWGTIESSLRNLIERTGADISRWVLALVFLPAEAYIVADAALRSIYRMTISRRNLLEWSTAAAVSRALGSPNHIGVYWRNLWIAPLTSIATGLAVYRLNPQALPAASILLILWFMSPLLALWLGRVRKILPTLSLDIDEERLIRIVARDTWRFFERFVGPDSNWLPPDNVQEYPTQTIAERTSPTNIGMLLLSTITAHDLGYLGQRQLISRLNSHLETVTRLQKHRGHLLNWYSTRDLQPLEPRYVSTVDSGNFVAALINVRQTMEQLPHYARQVERTLLGLSDEITALHRELFANDAALRRAETAQLRSALETAQSSLSNGDDVISTLNKLENQYCVAIDHAFLAALEHKNNSWSAEEIGNFRENNHVFRQRIRKILDDIELFSPWLFRLAAPPALFMLPDYQTQLSTLKDAFNNFQRAEDFSERADATNQLIADLSNSIPLSTEHELSDQAHTWLGLLQNDIARSRTAMRDLDRSRKTIIRITTEMIDGINFKFLYDSNRNLFRVGYNVSTGESDRSHYDLLASEARIASFIAIAYGDVPPKHWMHLGRPLTRLRGLRILLSWSATAFEYLMPRLVMHSPKGGLLDQSCRGAVQEQIRFGREHDIPWGISESGYAQFDPQNQYQYYAFGIPKLGLKWDQGERLVVSSYASLIALPYAPKETISNLSKLIELGAGGHYGLYEALDFGDAHKPRPSRPQVVKSYMAHHQGMILVAIGNTLNNDETLHRFHLDPRIASVEYLLYERLPQRTETRPLERLPFLLKELPNATATINSWQTETDIPETAVLSNGRLSSRVSTQGSGALYWHGMAVTRWDPLATGPTGGTRIYIKDLDLEQIICFGGDQLPEDVEVFFAPHHVEFRSRREELLMRMTITVAPSADVEIRRVMITNDGLKTRRILLSSYSEPVLVDEPTDRRHPAFSKLFIETQYIDEEKTLLFRRRPRGSNTTGAYYAHTAISEKGTAIEHNFEVDRSAFLGRGYESTKPASVTDPAYTFSNTSNDNLDPCAAIALTLEIPPRTTVQCAFLSATGENQTDVLEAMRPFRTLAQIDWTVAAARIHSEKELTGMHANSEDVRMSFRLFSKILRPTSLGHVISNAFYDVRRVQDSLWRHGISGDRPIITQCVCGENDIQDAQSILKCVEYLSHMGIAIDVIFLDETTGSYTTPFSDRLRNLIETHLAPGREQNTSTGFIVPIKNLAANEKMNLIAAARFYVDSRHFASTASFEAQLWATDRATSRMPAFFPQPSSPLTTQAISPVRAHEDLRFNNRYGGMLPDFSGYSMIVSSGSPTPAPWCNVLANPSFGTLVSEAGSMCTWWGNSSEYRLTPWHNDPVLDKTGEALYVRDEETGESWSLTPQAGSDPTLYRVTHVIGESLFEHNRHGLEQSLQIFVDREEPIKFLRLRFANKWPRPRRLTITFAVEWILGNNYSYDRHLLVPEWDDQTGALLVRNCFDRQGADELAFVACELPAHGVTANGREFFGKRQSWGRPPGLVAVGLSNQVEPSSDPCAIYQVHLDLAPAKVHEFHFVLGAASNQEAAAKLVTLSKDSQWVQTRYEMQRHNWDRLLGTWSVKTPDSSADAMINQWLLYQVISARLWGRIGFYQASGGFGFRDQLQDALALLDTDPAMTKSQLLLAAARQFPQGDVLHWWHETPLRGVRTRCSDDLLWLAYCAIEYIEVTDDRTILTEAAPYLQGDPLGEHELERYAEYQLGSEEGSLYEHCYRAIDARIAFGVHGLPFIGTGDWNDGLNQVGEKGQGESVWMAWFLIVICRGFSPLCRFMNDPGRADHYEAIAKDLLTRTRETAWTGDWYLRAYFDDGTPLGLPGDEESEIDLNAQTWAVIVDPNDQAACQAMRAAENKLFDVEHRLIKLLTPPFQKMNPNPGYICAYPPGVRENGGQYTHAAVWAGWALAAMGDQQGALRCFDWLNPLKRGRNDAEIAHYRIEPYVMPGDVYGAGGLTGRGGWSWYSGSAAWLYRFAIRQLLGLQRHGNRLFIRPCLPDTWPSFEARLRYCEAEIHFQVHNPSDFKHENLFVICDDAPLDLSSIVLQEHGQHRYEVFASEGARDEWLVTHPANPVSDAVASPNS